MQNDDAKKPSKKGGADDRDRTGDLTLTKRLLYHLSYVGDQIQPSQKT